MKIPAQRILSGEKAVLSSFGGLSLGASPGDGQFGDMLNLTGESYPVLSTRRSRGEINFGGADVFGIASLDVLIGGEIVRDAFIADCRGWLKAFHLTADGFVGTTLQHTTSFFNQQKKQMVECGGYLYFFPDNKYINLMNTDDKGSLDEKKTLVCGASDENARYYETVMEPCAADGTTSGDTTSHVRVIRNSYYLTGGGKGGFVTSVPYSAGFSDFDTVSVSGFGSGECNGTFTVEKISSDGFLVLGGSLEAAYTQSSGTVVVERSVPEMDYVISAENRLWGCRYGVDSAGKPVNEIYASALGDAKNWHRFMGVSTDSYCASVGKGGAFTGAVCYGGKPYFFKENCIIRVFGDIPADFSLTVSDVRGVERGSAESIAVVNDVLYYKTYSGIVRFDGGVPVNVDSALGTGHFSDAVAGCCNGRYYVSMKDGGGVRGLYVYDTSRKLWHRENDPGVIQFCRSGSELFMLCGADGVGDRVFSVNGTCNTDSESLGSGEGDFDWRCVTGNLGFESAEAKLLTSLTLRMELSPGGRCEVLCEYDGDGVWHTAAMLSGRGKSRFDVRIRPGRSDCFRLKLAGRGQMKLFSLIRESEKCGG